MIRYTGQTSEATPDLVPMPPLTPRYERSTMSDSTRSMAAPEREPIDRNDYPPYDGSMPIDLFKAFRRRQLKIDRAKRSPMALRRDENGNPLYKVTAGGCLSRVSNPSGSRRREVLERDGNACVWCGSQVDLEFDHIIRYVDGGDHSAANLRTLCAVCHRSRGGHA